MSNLARALARLYRGTRATETVKNDASSGAYGQVTRQMVDDIAKDIGDMKTIERTEFLMISGVVIAELIRFVVAR